ncbi:MAG TPA: dirigent protein [Gaiellaceae bacterium]|nr:dirigent protein [Gaiellaceae bacterium]
MRARGALLAAGLAALAGAPAAAAEKLTIQVTSVALSVKQTDRAPKGTSRGDTIVFRDRLVNAAAQFGRPKGAVVGSDRGTMTFTGAHTARFSGRAVLPGGTLRLEGKVVPLAGDSLAIPVAGGTGRFAKARGFLLVGPGEKRALNTYSLTLPSAPVA